MLQSMGSRRIGHDWVTEQQQQMQEMQEMGGLIWVGKIPWRRKWQLMPVFWPGKPHGQRSLVGYSSWGHKELVMTEQQQ